MSLDSALFLSINGSATSPHWSTALALFATHTLPQLLAGVIAGALFTGNHQTRQHVLRMLVAMAVAWLLAWMGKHFIPLDRPFVSGLGKQWLPHAATHSFPSAHASVAFALATVVLLMARQAHGTVLAALAVLAVFAASLIAWSRVYLGLHYPSDVMAGALAGAASGWLAWRLSFKNPLQSANAKVPT